MVSPLRPPGVLGGHACYHWEDLRMSCNGNFLAVFRFSSTLSCIPSKGCISEQQQIIRRWDKFFLSGLKGKYRLKTVFIQN